jgi:hypothetical protein
MSLEIFCFCSFFNAPTTRTLTYGIDSSYREFKKPGWVSLTTEPYLKSVDNVIMRLSLRLRTILLSVLALFIASQIFWQPFERAPDFKKALTTFAPIEFVFRYFDFNQKNALEQWEEKIFTGRVAYWLDFENSSGKLHAKSEQAASAIYHRLNYNAQEYPILTWRWRVKQFPKKREIEDAVARDDFAARVYVVFPSFFFTQIECIEYVWDEKLKEGTILESPFSDRIKQIVVQSGPASDEEWALESRNILEDYTTLFGKKPKKDVAAIAIMTDADGTEGIAEALFDDIQIGRGLSHEQ